MKTREELFWKVIDIHKELEIKLIEKLKSFLPLTLDNKKDYIEIYKLEYDGKVRSNKNGDCEGDDRICINIVFILRTKQAKESFDKYIKSIHKYHWGIDEMEKVKDGNIIMYYLKTEYFPSFDSFDLEDYIHLI